MTGLSLTKQNYDVLGPIPRAFCEQICPEGDYNCPPRPGSPSALINARSNGTSGYRHYQANGIGENFHGFSAHEGAKMPGSPIVGGQPHSIGSQDCSPHTYSNVQVKYPEITQDIARPQVDGISRHC